MNRPIVSFLEQFVRALGTGCAWVTVLWLAAYFLPGTVRPLLDLIVALSAALTHYANG